jgi:hypothetical protein
MDGMVPGIEVCHLGGKVRRRKESVAFSPLLLPYYFSLSLLTHFSA